MRLYTVKDVAAVHYVFVAAETATEARKIALAELDCDFIDVRVNWVKEADVKNCKKGIYTDVYKALKNGWCDFVDDECPVCGQDATIKYDADKDSFFCSLCNAYFKLEE